MAFEDIDILRQRFQNGQGFSGNYGGAFGGPYRRPQGVERLSGLRQRGTGLPGPYADANYRARIQRTSARTPKGGVGARRAARFDRTQAGVGGPIGAGFPGYRPPDFSKLDRIRRQQIGASKRLIDLEFEGVRKTLEGDIRQTELDRDFFVAQRERQLRGESRDVRGDALSRGILDSGIFLENLAEVETAATEEISHERNRAAALIGGYTSQIGLLAAQRAARIASERAQIEQAYFMARLSGY